MGADAPREDGPRYRVRAVERALAVLGAFTHDRQQLSLGELTAATGLSKPTVFRILSTLEHHRYVALDRAEGVYRLGPKLLELGGVALSSLGLRRAARPHLDELRRRTGVTVLYAALIDDQLVYIDKRESEGPIRIVSEVGLRRPPHYGMLGTVLLAFREEGEVRRLLADHPLTAHTPRTLTDEGAFQERLREVRETGYLVEEGEVIEGVWGVAAPVRDAGGEVVAAVGAARALIDKTEERTLEMVEAVRACADGISRALGWPGGAPSDVTREAAP